MAKFGRNYVLNVETQGGSTLTIRPPFTLEFDITRNLLPSSNISTIRVYNLGEKSRNQIRKNVNDYGDQRLIQLQAGYGDNTPVIFNGSITQAWSVREGVDFITQIESFDGGFAWANAISNLSLSSQNPTTQKAVIERLVDDLGPYGVLPGAIGEIPGTAGRVAYSGSTTDILRQLVGNRFFIDNGRAYILSANECIPGPITVINAQSGLLATPVREQTIVTFDMLFEPRLLVGQKISLQSVTEASFNGDYKVISLKHRGMISEAVCGSAITSVGLMQPLGFEALTTVGVP